LSCPFGLRHDGAFDALALNGRYAPLAPSASVKKEVVAWSARREANVVKDPRGARCLPRGGGDLKRARPAATRKPFAAPRWPGIFLVEDVATACTSVIEIHSRQRSPGKRT